MKKILVILCSPLFLFSQEIKHKITWESNFILESNSLDRSFLNSMLYGGYITDNMKSKWIDSGDKNNIIYAEIRNGLSYNYNFKKQSIGFSLADINSLNASFTDDLLSIGFKGNFYNQDKTLDFAGTSLRSDRFQQYKIKYGTAINNINLDIAFSYLAGNHHISYIIEKGSLYTAPFGTYLDVEYDMKAFVTDTSNFSVFANNGNGAAIDFSADFNIQEYKMQLSVSDLGFIMWNPSSITLASDSTFSFQGIEVEDVFNFNDSVLDANNIIDDEPQTNTRSFKSYIPATIHFSFIAETEYTYFKTYTAGFIAKWQPYMDNKLLSLAKINQGFRESNFTPLYYIHSVLNAKYYDIIPTLSYGGYSNDMNIGLAISRGQKNKFVIGTHQLEDAFKVKESKAASIYFSLTKYF